MGGGGERERESTLVSRLDPEPSLVTHHTSHSVQNKFGIGLIQFSRDRTRKARKEKAQKDREPSR